MLYLFNPGHEYAIVSASPYYMHPANMVKMQEDLAYLSAWYANSNDCILIPTDLTSSYLNSLTTNGILLAKGITQAQINASNNRTSKVHCWGRSPQAINFFEAINKRYHLQLDLPKWDDRLRTLSSRQFSKTCLEYLLNRNKEIQANIVPNYYNTLAEIKRVVLTTKNQLIAKAPYSSSGKGLLWLPIDGLTQTEEQIIHGILKKQGMISLENALERVVDFAMEFNISDKDFSCTFLGYSLFKTNAKGGYEGNYIGSQENMLSKLTEYIDRDLLDKIKEDLKQYFEKEFNTIYSGCIGVDMMVYKHGDTYLLHPCVEINVRDNMGLIALHIYKKHIEPTSHGYFYIDFHKNTNDLIEKHNQMLAKYPLHCKHGKITSGYLSLCPISENTKYRAYLLINR